MGNSGQRNQQDMELVHGAIEKGLVDVVDKVLPGAHHRYCMRHVESNWCKKWRSGEMRKLMWWCSWSSYDEEFKDQLKRLGQLSEETTRDLEKSAENASRKGKSPMMRSNSQSRIIGEDDDLEKIQAATQDFEPNDPDVGNEEDPSLRPIVYCNAPQNPLPVWALERIWFRVTGSRASSAVRSQSAAVAVLEYMKWAKPIIEKPLEVLLERLNVKQIDEPIKSVVMGTLIVNLIHYPVCPSLELITGAGRHTDVSSITMLLQDDVGGLYVREPKVMAGFMCH
ncbi:Feruloyl CoA ortho-hydroxylase 2 [Capsicum chinense]|nr:Feruloyl CoA ortho-hydroxylase 2 [Capsicum chinense]